jgi:uncharacterized protein YbjT (DUF2867 family)
MIVALIGASGLIGHELLQLLLDDSYYTEIHVLVRKSLNIRHEKLQEKVINFQDHSAFSNAIPQYSGVFSCIGTTQKKVNGDQQAYREVDFDITVHAAKIAKQKHATHFLFVSAIGANPKSNNLYLQLKGEIEIAVEQVQLPRVGVIRPSLLLGKRNETRIAEQLGQWIMPIFSWLLPYRYRPIQANKLAAKMIEMSKSTSLGWHVVEGKELFIANHG